MKEKKTDVIYLKIEPSVKAAAMEKAKAEGRTLSNYIVNLIKKDTIYALPRGYKFEDGKIVIDEKEADFVKETFEKANEKKGKK